MSNFSPGQQPLSRDGEAVVSSWCNSRAKRVCDLSGAFVLLLLLAPILLVLSVAVKLTSRGPVLFKQRRPGRNGREFCIVKFRTMFAEQHSRSPVLTRAEDPRVTQFGGFMRKWKLDELPQLVNVLRGEMSFVGPRPQPTRLWQEPSIARQATVVLSVRPGITSQATLVFRNEEGVLAPLNPEEVEKVYQCTLMPLKLNIEMEYLRRATFLSDAHIVLRTIARIFLRRHEGDGRLKQRVSSASQSALSETPEADSVSD